MEMHRRGFLHSHLMSWSQWLERFLQTQYPPLRWYSPLALIPPHRLDLSKNGIICCNSCCWISMDLIFRKYSWVPINRPGSLISGEPKSPSSWPFRPGRYSLSFWNKAKRFANHLLSDVISGLACLCFIAISCEQNNLEGYQNKKLRGSFVNCFSLRIAVKISNW